MTVAGYCLVMILSLAYALGHSNGRAIEIYYASVGHLLLLRCGSADGHTNRVSWSMENQTLGMVSGVDIREGDLWFLPIEASHNGTYVCKKRNDGESWEMEFHVSVSTGQCPPSSEIISITQGTNDVLPCKVDRLLKQNKIEDTKWLKECNAVERTGKPYSVDHEGRIRLPYASESDAGLYTCLMDISLDGRSFTTARSIQLRIDNDTLFYNPIITYPKNQVIVVEQGSAMELHCLYCLGTNEDEETLMYWTINSNETSSDSSTKCLYDKGWVDCESTLFISKLLPEFLNVPITCHVENPSGYDNGTLWLQEADHNVFYICLTVCLLPSLLLLAGVVGFLFFKVELVLAYRQVCSCLVKQQTPDGNVYDAYVSYPHGDGVTSSETMRFALQVLPEVLENRHGFSLYIRGRDDLPGEAMHDVIATTVRQSRRLIIIVSDSNGILADAKMDEALPLQHTQSRVSYEQRICLYDTLTQNGPCVILVEIDGPVDYSSLPESLRYIKKRQGALKWSSVNTLPTNKLFWKHLRYNMPSRPAGRPTPDCHL